MLAQGDRGGKFLHWCRALDNLVNCLKQPVVLGLEVEMALLSVLPGGLPRLPLPQLFLRLHLSRLRLGQPLLRRVMALSLRPQLDAQSLSQLHKAGL